MNERRRRSRHRSRGSITGTSSQRLRWQRLPLRDFLGNAGLREAWNRLNGSRGGLPFLDIEVVELACQAFRPKGVELLLGEVSGQPQCMLLLQRQGLGRWQLYQPAQIPLGLIVAASSLSLEGIANSALRFLGFQAVAKDAPSRKLLADVSVGRCAYCWGGAAAACRWGALCAAGC